MTDNEAMARFVKVFGGYIPSFENTKYWERISQGAKWMQETYGDSPFNEACQKYLRACYEIASIEFEMIKERGKNIERCRSENS